MTRKLVLASAGAGKSRLIVEQAIKSTADGESVLILTYTESNQKELVKKFCEANKFLPSSVTIKGWFSFLLEDMIRPYQACIFEERIPNIYFNSCDPHKRNGRNIPGRKEKTGSVYNPEYFLTKNDGKAHTTYLSKLAVRVDTESNKKPIGRLSEIYGAVFVDEVQDLTGWDFKVLELIAKSDIGQLYCVGDFRQTIYTTHISTKKPKANAEKLCRFVDITPIKEQLNVSWRCIQKICDFADLVHLDEGIYKATESQVTQIPPQFSDHLGIFVVRPQHVRAYLKKFRPTILRASRVTQVDICDGREAYNFGEAKGMGFERVLICATVKHKQFLSGNYNAFDGDKTTKAKNALYVAITRAKYSVAFLTDGKVDVDGLEVWVADAQ